MEVFRVEKRKFDMEVSKWDDNGNDIIVLAKHMCLIMMEMTDFTRGKGNIKFYIHCSLEFSSQFRKYFDFDWLTGQVFKIVLIF